MIGLGEPNTPLNQNYCFFQKKIILECNDIISDLAELTTSYRYSKLLSLMLLDCIATSPNSADLIRRLYIYASSQSDKSGPHVKME